MNHSNRIEYAARRLIESAGDGGPWVHIVPSPLIKALRDAIDRADADRFQPDESVLEVRQLAIDGGSDPFRP